jgi:hypothetical protein
VIVAVSCGALRRFALATSLLSAASACAKRDTAPPVATVAFAASQTRVAQGSPVDLTYEFDVAPDAVITGDYRVFVHVDDTDGKVLWTDDHQPPIPTSQWKPGQKIRYTRTVFVPVYPYVGEATIELGLYKGNDRLPLKGPDPADRTSTSRSYRVGTLQLLDQSSNVFLVYKSGWHPAEYAPDSPTIDWQWTQKSAVISFRNPRHDVMFYLQYDARPDVFDHPQQVTVTAGDQTVETFSADHRDRTLLRIPISAAQLGTGDMAEIRLDVDRTFVPANLPGGAKDPRELGIRVYHAFIGDR